MASMEPNRPLLRISGTPLASTFVMFFKILGVACIAFSLPANALVCFATSPDLTQLSWPSLKVTSGEHELDVIGADALPPADRKEVIGLLTDENMTFSDVAERGQKILSVHHEILANQAALLLFLQGQLKDSRIDYVLVDANPDAVKATEALAQRLYLQAFQMQLHSSPSDVSLDRLILMTVGAPFYLKAANPERFDHVKLEGWPVKADGDSAAESRADEAFERLKEKLAHSRQSLRTAEDVNRRLKRGEYAHLSPEELREKILSRFWRPAQGPVGEWLNAEISAEKNRGKIAHAEPAREKPVRESPATEASPRRPRVRQAGSRDSTTANEGLAQTLLTHDGKGTVILTPETFSRLKKELHSLCDGE